MDFSEKNISLSDEDCEKINSIGKKALIGSGIFGIFFFGVLGVSSYSMIQEGGPGLIFLSLFVVTAIGVFIFTITRILKKLKKDIENGTKKRIFGTVTDKQFELNRNKTDDVQATRYKYYLFFGDKKIKVDKNAFDKTTVGSAVELDLSSLNEIVLEFRNLNSFN